MTRAKLTHQHLSLGERSLHLVEAGQDHPDRLVFLHGWPKDWTEWQRVMELARKTHQYLPYHLIIPLRERDRLSRRQEPVWPSSQTQARSEMASMHDDSNEKKYSSD